MLTTGTVLQNRYRVEASLGEGGMGAVYRVWDTRLDAPLALKEMTSQPGLDPQILDQLRRQFRQEASILANLSHPNLVDVTDFFEEGDHTYLVMKLVEGESLAERIRRKGPLPEHEVLELAGQLLDALAYCHGKGVIHRDIKPQNIIVRPDGQGTLVDFGLVKLWDPSHPDTKTVMQGIGTVEYAPPEQFGTRTGHTDPRSDLYSLGATLYHALTGQAPMAATDRMATPDEFIPLRHLNSQVSSRTETAILRAMEVTLDSRFKSVDGMRAALGLSGGREAVEARPAALPWKGVPGWAWILGSLAAVALAVGVVVGVWPRIPEPTPTKPPPTPTAAPAPTATPAGPARGDTWTRPADGGVMVYVPAGEFQMGSSDEEVNDAQELCDEHAGDCERAWFEDEHPAHVVALDGFWIDRTEVTNGQYRQCVEAGECNPPTENRSYTRDSYYGNGAYDGYPVIYVNWHQATAYCEWVGARLPTEAEWEYAARGPEGLVFPWGNTFDGTRLNYCDVGCNLDWADGAVDDGYADTAPVGSYPGGASWCGAQDLAGNVWEWVADWYGEYPPGRQVNPTGPSSGENQVMRGGSWEYPPHNARSADRLRIYPTFADLYTGFRCAREP